MSLVYNTRVFILLCCFTNGSLFFGQCVCTIDIVDNSQPSYLLNAGETACIYADVIYTGAITIQGGTLCNYGSIDSGELIFESGEINNSGHITVRGEFNIGANCILNNNLEFETETLRNFGTINLGQKSFLGTFNLYSYENAFINGPPTIDADSTNYSMVFVSEISENRGSIQGHLVFKDLSYEGESIYRIDTDFGGAALIDYPTVLFDIGASDSGPRGPMSCPYSVLIFPSSNFDFCSGASMNFGASLLYNSGNLSTYIAPSVPFVWTINPTQPSGISSGTFNDAYDIYGATSSYVISVSNAHGYCSTASIPVIATMKNLVANAGPSIFIPYGGQTAIGATPVATGGTAPYTYLWTPSTSYTSGTTTSEHPVVNPAVTTIYQVSVSDANTSCSATSTMAVIVEQFPHAVLKRNIDGGYYKVNTTTNTLYFKYDDEYKNSNVVLDYKIYKQDHSNSTSAYSCSSLTPFYGDNRFALNLTTCTPQALTTGQFYVLEVQNEKKEKFYLKFYY